MQVACSLLRKITAAYITANPGTVVDGRSYDAFLTHTLGVDLEEYCDACVCPLGRPVDTIMMDGNCRCASVSHWAPQKQYLVYLLDSW